MPSSSDSFRGRVREASKGGKIWKPGVDDCIVGRLVGIRDIKTKMGNSRITDIADEESGELVSVWMTVVLQHEFEDQKIEIGERIGLHYLGNERGYHDYIVMVDRDVSDGKEKEK